MGGSRALGKRFRAQRLSWADNYWMTFQAPGFLPNGLGFRGLGVYGV